MRDRRNHKIFILIVSILLFLTTSFVIYAKTKETKKYSNEKGLKKKRREKVRKKKLLKLKILTLLW